MRRQAKKYRIKSKLTRKTKTKNSPETGKGLSAAAISTPLENKKHFPKTCSCCTGSSKWDLKHSPDPVVAFPTSICAVSSIRRIKHTMPPEGRKAKSRKECCYRVALIHTHMHICKLVHTAVWLRAGRRGMEHTKCKWKFRFCFTYPFRFRRNCYYSWLADDAAALWAGRIPFAFPLDRVCWVVIKTDPCCPSVYPYRAATTTTKSKGGNRGKPKNLIETGRPFNFCSPYRGPARHTHTCTMCLLDLMGFFFLARHTIVWCAQI